MEAATIISVPLEGKVCTGPMGHHKLVNFYYSCRCHYDSIIFIDFSKLFWIDANLSATLQAILYKLNKENRLLFNVDVNDVSNRFPILFRNGFLSNLLALPDGYRSTVEMKLFYPEQDIDFYYYITQSLLGNIRMTQHNKDDIVGHYMELFSNIQKHANTVDPVFVCGQYFPRESRLNFTLVDLGVGFLPPIHKYTDGDISCAEEAIKWAVKYRHSTQNLDKTGGLGLHNLLNHCSNSGGHFNIATGDAYWGNNLGELGTRTIPEFVGTTIHLIYNCK